MKSDETKAKAKVLVIDDDVDQCLLIKQYLEQMSYGVMCVHTGPAGLEEAKTENHNVVILDVNLPGMDGFEVLRELRKSSETPVIMLTTFGDEPDRIVGLELGADDYLPKPFSMRELMARIRALHRRSTLTQKNRETETLSTLEFGDLKIEPDSRTITIQDAAVELTPVEFDLLVCLATAKGRVLTRDHLLEVISGRSYDVFDRVIDVHISSLRKKLNDNPKTPRFIKTVRSAGYMFLDKE